MKNIGILRKHKLSGAIIWFPSGFAFLGEAGVVVTDTHPYIIGFSYRYWDQRDLEETDYEIEINLRLSDCC